MNLRLGPEDSLQSTCVQWFRIQFPKDIIYAVPNGGHRHPLTAIKLKMTGVLAGIPDLCIPCPNVDFNGMYIEMKAGKNKPTPEQLRVIEYLKCKNYKVSVINNFDIFKNVVTEYMKEKIGV